MKDLTKGKESKVILAFAVPMLISNLVQQTYTVVDSIIVGRAIGKAALSAVSITIPISFAIFALMIGLTMGTTVTVGQFFGANDSKSLRSAISTSYIIIFLCSMILAIAGFLFSYNFLEILNTPTDIINDATLYLKITFLGVPFMFIYNIITSMLRGLGNSKTPLYFLVLSSIINILFSSLLVIGFGLGVPGSSYGTLVATFSTFSPVRNLSFMG